MSLTILTDTQVCSVLQSLSPEDVDSIQHALSDALHQYSTATNDNACCSSNQPSRTHLTRPDGSVALFMPSATDHGMGVKVVTVGSTDVLREPSSDRAGEPRVASRSDIASMTGGSDTASTLSDQMSTLTWSDTGSTPRSSDTGRSTASSDRLSTAKKNERGGSANQSENTTVKGKDDTVTSRPRGSLTLFSPNGRPSALINATELTAFRTALASTILFKRRKSVHTITVFGAGKQAYWHIRLALLLRPHETHHVNIITRSFDRAGPLLEEIYSQENGGNWPPHSAKITVLSREYNEYERLLKERVRAADVIFCCTPSTERLFPASFLTSPEGKRKGRLVSAIGSYKPTMMELDPELLRHAVAPHHQHRHIHKSAPMGGAIVVDSISACLEEAGEVIKAQLRPEEVVELGELFILKREAMRTGHEIDQGLSEWIERGNVVYKSVGLGLMDVVVGGEVVRIAEERGVGTTVEDF